MFEANFVQQVDEYIEQIGLEVPIEKLPKLRDGYEVNLIPELDLKTLGITSVIWATGYKFDFSLVKLPVLDEDGFRFQPPYKLVNNEYSALDAADLVFIDPVSTGYSRAVPGVSPKKFHGFREDIESVGEFIRFYITRYGRGD